MSKSKKRLRRLVICALFAAVLCVISPFAIPTTIPLTLATLGIYICALVLPPAMSAASVGMYLAIGALGVPVFSGFTGGIGKFAAPTGGYLAGYLPMALAISAVMALWRRVHVDGVRSRTANAVVGALACVVGTVVLYALGTAWFVIEQRTTLGSALTLCVIPFIPGDAAKIAAAVVVEGIIRKKIVRGGTF